MHQNYRIFLKSFLILFSSINTLVVDAANNKQKDLDDENIFVSELFENFDHEIRKHYSFYATKQNENLANFINTFAKSCSLIKKSRLYFFNLHQELSNLFILQPNSFITQIERHYSQKHNEEVQNRLKNANAFINLINSLVNWGEAQKEEIIHFLITKMILNAATFFIYPQENLKKLETLLEEGTVVNKEDLFNKFPFLKTKINFIENNETIEDNLLINIGFHYPLYESFSEEEEKYNLSFNELKDEIKRQFYKEFDNYSPWIFPRKDSNLNLPLYYSWSKIEDFLKTIWFAIFPATTRTNAYIEDCKKAQKKILNNWYYKKYGLSSDALRSLLRSQYQETKELAQTIIEKEIVYFEGGTIEASLHLLTLAEKYLAKSNNVKGYKEFINETNRNKGNTFLLKRNLGILETAIYYVEIKHEHIDLYKKFKDEKSDIFIDFNKNREWSNFFPSDENKDKIIECFAFTAQEVIDCPVYVQHFKEKIEYIASKKDNRIAAIEIYYVNDLPSDIRQNLEKDLQGKFVKSYGNFRKYQIFQ